MDLQLTHQTRLAVDRHGVFGRRDFLRAVSAGSLAAGAASWTDLVSLRADELRQRGKACILLWMQGGPSQFETFDPKPGHANGGETKTIETSVSGLQVAENLPHLAKVMDQVALIRSMTTKEGNHQRASFLLHTAHAPTASVHYPTMGSVVSHQLGDPQSELPSFVRVGRRFPNSGAGGLLGTIYDPFVAAQAGRLPDNARPTTDTERYQRRLSLLSKLDATDGGAGTPEVADHRGLYEKASRMVLSSNMQAFDLSQEPEQVRSAYGEGDFAAGCLLARRLVQAGVTFVEVGLGNWDTHDNNFDRCRDLTGQMDQAFAYLIEDLRQQGMLDQTLVVWMGEFGRTPRINPRAGRDHYPRAFSAALAGGGIQGGRVVGKTDESGSEVTDRPVTAPDLFRTVYQGLGINPDKENMSPIGRPIKIVEGGQAVSELFS